MKRLSRCDLAILNDLAAEAEEQERRGLELVARVHHHMSGIVQDTKDYYEDRSDAWKESEKGESYQAWINSLEELSGAMKDGLESLRIAIRDGRTVRGALVLFHAKSSPRED